MVSVQDLIDVNESQIRAIERELLVLKSNLRKPNTEKKLSEFERRIAELTILGRKLLAERKVLAQKLTTEPAKVIKLGDKRKELKKKKSVRDIGRSWVRYG